MASRQFLIAYNLSRQASSPPADWYPVLVHVIWDRRLYRTCCFKGFVISDIQYVAARVPVFLTYVSVNTEVLHLSLSLFT